MIMVTQCPQKDSLVNFLLGKLDIDDREQVESHLSDCRSCVETIKSIELHDTLDGLAQRAFTEQAQLDSPGESQIISRLIDQLQSLPSDLDRSTSSVTVGHRSHHNPVHDRAAEVQRLLDAPTRVGDLGQLGKYQIHRLLGAGSSGVVYLANDTQLERPVALKILRPSLGGDARQRFLAEAQATAKIAHANVVQIFDVGLEGPLAFIAMQWLPGQTLEEKLCSQPTLPPDEAVQLSRQIADGLAAAHEFEMIHRDIKPANIWIPENGEAARILDFGLVRVTDENPQLTCTGMIAGTPCYMSPEQSRGESLDPRSDLFSLGCLMYQCTTGKLPFHHDNALATLQAIQRQQPEHPCRIDPAIPKPLGDLILQLLEKSRHRRPVSAGAVVDLLDQKMEQWTGVTDYPIENSTAETEAKTPMTKPNGFFSRTGFGWLVAMLMLGVCGWAGFAFAPQIIRIATNRGEVIIDTKVDDVQIEMLQNGERIRIIDTKTKQSFDVTAGQYELRPLSDDNSISLDKNLLSLKRGGRVIVTVTQNEKTNPTAERRPNANVGPAYQIQSGDTLAIQIDHVFKMNDESIPILETDFGPVIGYPIQVDQNGFLVLPFIEPVPAKGLTCTQLREVIFHRYTDGENAILKENPFVQVALVRINESSPNQLAPPRETSGNASSDGNSQFENPTSRASDPKDPTLAYFQGKTLAEWMTIIQHEREIEQVKLAVRGMANLRTESDELRVAQLIGESMRHKFYVEDPRHLSSFAVVVQSYLTSVRTEILITVTSQEFSDGNENSQQILSEFYRRTFQNYAWELRNATTDQKRQLAQKFTDAFHIDQSENQPRRLGLLATVAAYAELPLEDDALNRIKQNDSTINSQYKYALAKLYVQQAPEYLTDQITKSINGLIKDNRFVSYRYTQQIDQEISIDWNRYNLIGDEKQIRIDDFQKYVKPTEIPMVFRGPLLKAHLELWNKRRAMISSHPSEFEKNLSQIEVGKLDMTMCAFFESMLKTADSRSLEQLRVDGRVSIDSTTIRWSARSLRPLTDATFNLSIELIQDAIAELESEQ
ncbi:MAG: protein kinase [Planctomycetota bacterium]